MVDLPIDVKVSTGDARTDLNRVKEDIEDVGDAAEDAGRKAEDSSGGFGGLRDSLDSIRAVAGAAAVGSLVAFGNQLLENADQIRAVSFETGYSTDQVQIYDQALRAAGFTADEAREQIKSLEQAELDQAVASAEARGAIDEKNIIAAESIETIAAARDTVNEFSASLTALATEALADTINAFVETEDVVDRVANSLGIADRTTARYAANSRVLRERLAEQAEGFEAVGAGLSFFQNQLGGAIELQDVYLQRALDAIEINGLAADSYLYLAQAAGISQAAATGDALLAEDIIRQTEGIANQRSTQVQRDRASGIVGRGRLGVGGGGVGGGGGRGSLPATTPAATDPFADLRGELTSQQRAFQLGQIDYNTFYNFLQSAAQQVGDPLSDLGFTIARQIQRLDESLQRTIERESAADERAITEALRQSNPGRGEVALSPRGGRSAGLARAAGRAGGGGYGGGNGDGGGGVTFILNLDVTGLVNEGFVDVLEPAVFQLLDKARLTGRL